MVLIFILMVGMTHLHKQHSLFEDVQAILSATLIIALGLLALKTAGMVTGGTAGMALLLHYVTGWRLGMVLFFLNLPFYWLAWHRLGVRFTLKTFIAVGVLSVWTELLPMWLGLSYLNPLFAAVVSGLLIGVGLLMLFRHQASLGGVGIVAVYLQNKHGWRAGYVQLAVDGLIMLCAFMIVPWEAVSYSMIAIAILNGLLVVNHKPSRYSVLS